MATNINGLTYYKLDSNLHGYPGDITKNSGLRGEEIDANFNFLRGNEIKKVSFDDAGTMTITKYNGETLRATIVEKEQRNYDFSYDSKKGTLTIITPNGEEIVLEGFNIATNVHADVYHDYSLTGDGSKESILKVSNITKTGRYLPAISLIDITQGETLPTEGVKLHDRYVSKESISNFGLLYPLEGMRKISEDLKSNNSEWHIPTKAEWDELLNAVDCNMPNHDSKDSNVDLGEFAGSILKSKDIWIQKDGELLSEDTYNFSVLPVGYCGNRGVDFFGSLGKSTAFWTSSVEDRHDDMYVKIFDYDKRTVSQNSWGEKYYLSIRLVKTYTGSNYNESEVIDGVTVNCVQIPGTTTVWTQENIGFTNEKYLGFNPGDDWKEYASAENRYFVNDWNGVSWDKHGLKNGESIVLRESENGNWREWMLVEGELKDHLNLVNEDLTSTITELRNEISANTNTINTNYTNLSFELDNEEKERKDSDTKLKTEFETAIKELSGNTQTQFNTITDNLSQTASTLNNKIEQVSGETKEYIDGLIEQEKTDRNAAISNLSTKIDINIINNEDSSLVITRNESSTSIKVQIDKDCEHIKLGENGIYFDGDFGTF